MEDDKLLFLTGDVVTVSRNLTALRLVAWCSGSVVRRMNEVTQR